MKKQILSLLLTLCLVCSLLPGAALAASDKATKAADALYELGLFSGTGTDANGKPIYDLDRAPNRQEAIVMLVRLLGKVEEAANGSWNIPFTDVAEWAKPYVGYAYTNGLAFGVSKSAFGSGDIVSASQYLTFVLRALGYESGTDFQWDKAWELSDQIGLTSGEYNSASSFLRGDAAIVSNNALSINKKGTNTPLIDILPKQTNPNNSPQKPGTPTISVSRAYHNFGFKLGDHYGYYEMHVDWTAISEADGYTLYVKEGDWGEWSAHKTYSKDKTSDVFAYWFEEVWYFKVVAFTKNGSEIIYGNESNTVSHKYRLYG